MSHSVTLDPFDAAPSFPALAVGQTGISSGAPDEPYTIRVVDMEGTLIAELTTLDEEDRNQAFPEDIIETLNAPLEFAITFPKWAFTRADVDILGTPDTPMEIQVLLGNEVIAWGPAIGQQGGGGTVTLQCAGVDWYFTKRALDENEENLIRYGGFEHGDFEGWRTSGPYGDQTIGDADITATVETDLVFQGSYAARIETSSTPDNDLAIVSNPAYFTAGDYPVRVALNFTVFLETFIHAAHFYRGVVLVGGPPGANGGVQGGINAKGRAVWRLDVSTPRRVELHQSLVLRIPPRKTWAFQVLVYGPHGSVVYDNFFLKPHRVLDTNNEGFGKPIDVARIVRTLLMHTTTTRHAKSPLHIVADVPLTGVKLTRRYSFQDHLYLDQMLAEFTSRDDCFEYQMQYTPTTRTFKAFPIADGGMGRDLTADVTLTLGDAWIVDYNPTNDGGAIATSVAALGEGDITREEAWAEDATQIGGTTLQATVMGLPGSDVNTLEATAREGIALRRSPPRIIEITLNGNAGGYGPDSSVILRDFLRLGDRFMLDIPDGWHTYNGTWRIVRRTRHCRARTATITLNEVPA